MGGIALLARSLGHQVSGSDAHVYPPMSTQLAAAGVKLADERRLAAHLAVLAQVHLARVELAVSERQLQRGLGTGHRDGAQPGDRHGPPAGCQLVGRPFDEATLLAIGEAHEAATDWHLRVPAATPL